MERMELMDLLAFKAQPERPERLAPPVPLGHKVQLVLVFQE